MEIDFYGSRLCPRCRKAAKHLQELQAKHPNIHINYIEVISSPLKTLGNRIFMIPALKTSKRQLSAVFLSKERIELFLQQALEVDK